MSAFNYDELKKHVGHKVKVITYGDNENVSCECIDCNEVLLDYDSNNEKRLENDL